MPRVFIFLSLGWNRSKTSTHQRWSWQQCNDGDVLEHSCLYRALEANSHRIGLDEILKHNKRKRNHLEVYPRNVPCWVTSEGKIYTLYGTYSSRPGRTNSLWSLNVPLSTQWGYHYPGIKTHYSLSTLETSEFQHPLGSYHCHANASPSGNVTAVHRAYKRIYLI